MSHILIMTEMTYIGIELVEDKNKRDVETHCKYDCKWEADPSSEGPVQLIGSASDER